MYGKYRSQAERKEEKGLKGSQVFGFKTPAKTKTAPTTAHSKKKIITVNEKGTDRDLRTCTLVPTI